MSDVLEHIREPDQLLNEVFRLLRPSGTLLINTPFYYWLHEEPHDYCRYTEFWLRARLEAAGFTDIAVDPLGGYLEVLADLISKGFGHSQRLPPGISRGVQRLTLRLGDRTLGAKVRERTGRKFPLSYGTSAVKLATSHRRLG